MKNKIKSVLLLLLLTVISSLADSILKSEWEAFKQKYNKVYLNQVEEKIR